MAVYKRTYKAFQGTATPAWSRFMVLSRYGFSTLFDSRIFTGYAVLCLVPFLIGVGVIYGIHSSAVQALLNIRMGQQKFVDNEWFYIFLACEAWMGFILTAWAAPGMITKDFANHGIQLYLSRPLSRTEYLLGKIGVLAALLSCTTWIPALVLFGLQAQLEGNGWGLHHLWMAGSITLAGLMWIALISLLSMALSVWVRWRIAATASIFAVFFLLPGFSEAVDVILRTHLGRLLNLPYLMTMVWAHLFRMRNLAGFQYLPLWSAWASLLAVCGFCVFILDRRLQAREVERG
jgi:ABC-2 type transport system permease protein